jgi:pyruvate kinase
LNFDTVKELKDRDVVEDGDIVLITKGDLEVPGATNALKLVQVGSMLEPGMTGTNHE